jgi:hypothetical protein
MIMKLKLHVKLIFRISCKSPFEYAIIATELIVSDAVLYPIRYVPQIDWARGVNAILNVIRAAKKIIISETDSVSVSTITLILCWTLSPSSTLVATNISPMVSMIQKFLKLFAMKNRLFVDFRMSSSSKVIGLILKVFESCSLMQKQYVCKKITIISVKLSNSALSVNIFCQCLSYMKFSTTIEMV